MAKKKAKKVTKRAPRKAGGPAADPTPPAVEAPQRTPVREPVHETVLVSPPPLPGQQALPGMAPQGAPMPMPNFGYAQPPSMPPGNGTVTHLTPEQDAALKAVVDATPAPETGKRKKRQPKAASNGNGHDAGKKSYSIELRGTIVDLIEEKAKALNLTVEETITRAVEIAVALGEPDAKLTPVPYTEEEQLDSLMTWFQEQHSA